MRSYAQLWLGMGLVAALGADEPVSYALKIRPILSDKCFACHGPDGAKREAGLRLDTFEGAVAVLENSGERAVVPGNLEASEAWKRMVSEDEDEVMPPRSSHLVLTEEEKQLIRRWIEQGAKYEPHWAFQALPVEVEVPEVKEGSWVRQEVDAFVLKRLEDEGIRPSGEASPERWLRRVSVDLTGLAPETETLKRFLERHAVDPVAAKVEVVDLLLESPRFGEHFAVGWLDQARYADSYGYQADQLTEFWPWRDWVIRAFNRNQPMDAFITWQVAGDLVEGGGEEAKIASAFQRLHRLTNEGGSIAEEFLVENMADRLHTFGSAFLALTMECSRCHDHKYDPISMRDYYSLGAFFQGIPERGFYSAASIQPSPSMLLPSEEERGRLAQARAKVFELERALEERRGMEDPAFDAWWSGLAEVRPEVGLVSHLTFDGEGPAGDLGDLVSGVAAARGNGLTRVPGLRGEAVALDGDRGIALPGRWQGERSEPFTIDLVFRDTVMNPAPVVLVHRTFGTDVGYNGLELLLTGGRIEARVVRDWPGNAVGVRTMSVVEKGVWSRVTVTYDGSSRASGLVVWLNGKRMEVEVTADHLEKAIVVGTHGDGTATIGERFRDRGFRGGEVDELRLWDRALTALEVMDLDGGGVWKEAVRKREAMREEWRVYWHEVEDKRAAEVREALKQARRELVRVEQGIRDLPIMREGAARPAHVLARGAYDAPRTEENRVEPGVFGEILPKFPEGLPRNRLGLARWLTSSDHPLTSRVFVNRVWANFFGEGLVETTDNFGLQGGLPSHPELLDWLARDFVDHGWNLKRLCRQLALSATYAQDSRVREDLREVDPGNRMLARMLPRRFSAEVIRDMALQAGGLLKERQGGPPVSPYQPGEDLWRESNSMSPAYRRSSGDDLFRRSLYSVWKRTAPLPNQTAFDAPTREICVIRRSATNTPMQALVLLNDVTYVEAARGLAARVRGMGDSRLGEAYQIATGRRATEEELAVLRELEEMERKRFGADAELARKYLGQGESPVGRDGDPVETAALAVVCQAILNLDASVWRR